MYWVFSISALLFVEVFVSILRGDPLPPAQLVYEIVLAFCILCYLPSQASMSLASLFGFVMGA